MSSEGNTVRPTAGAQADDSDSQHGVLTEDEGEGVLAPLGFLRGSSFILQFYWGLWKRYSQINISSTVWGSFPGGFVWVLLLGNFAFVFFSASLLDCYRWNSLVFRLLLFFD